LSWDINDEKVIPKDSTLNLYFLRHGETAYSQTGGFCGFTDAELTSEGKQMAQQFADAYKHIEFEGVYCSSLKRCIETARPLASAQGKEIEHRDGLKEINYGTWEGLTHDFVKEQFADDYEKWIAEPGWNAPTGGETAFQIAGRSMNVIGEILFTHLSGNVLVVSHKATIRIIICCLLGIELGRYRDRVSALAGSLSVIKMGKHGPLLELLNDRSYMSQDLRSRTGT
jgi:broad specificity phosphatase PhoE